MIRTARGVATKLATLLTSSDQYAGRAWEITSMIPTETSHDGTMLEGVQLTMLDPIEEAEYIITVRRKSIAPAITATVERDDTKEPPF